MDTGSIARIVAYAKAFWGLPEPVIAAGIVAFLLVYGLLALLAPSIFLPLFAFLIILGLAYGVILGFVLLIKI